MTDRKRIRAIAARSLGLAAVLIGLAATPAAAAPFFGVQLERDLETVSRSDERLDYTIKVNNISAATSAAASVGDALLCAGADPIKTWSPVPPNRPVNSFEWWRGGQPIPGETAVLHVATPADAGKPLQCLVRGENAVAAAVEASQPVAVVNPQPAIAPPSSYKVNFLFPGSRPTIGGTGLAKRTCEPPANWNISASATTTSGSNTLSEVATAKGSGNRIGPAAGTGDLSSGSTTVSNVTTTTGNGTLATGSKNVTGVSTSTGAFAAGQTISGSGIPANATIARVISATELELSVAATASGAQALSAGVHPFAVGQTIEGAGIPAATTITAIAGQMITLSNAATAGGAGVSLTGLASNVIGAVKTSSGVFRVGQTVSGAGIPAASTIMAIGADTLELSAAATATGQAQELRAGSVPFTVGEEIVGRGIPAATTIAAVSGQMITLSNNATASASGTIVSSPAIGSWAYQWLLNAEPIAAAEAAEYQPMAADQGKILQCRVTGTNAGGATVGISNNSEVGTVAEAPSNGPFNTPEVIANPTTATLELPGGEETHVYKFLNPTSPTEEAPTGWGCDAEPATGIEAAKAICASFQTIAPGGSYPPLGVAVALGADAPQTAVATATVSGSGSPEPAVATDEFSFSPFKEFGIEQFEAKVSADSKEEVDYTQAGGHPVIATARIGIAAKRKLARTNNRATAKLVPVEHAKSVVVDTPRGFVGNALAVTELCGGVEDVVATPPTCPTASRVGAIHLTLSDLTLVQPIYAIKPEFGVPVQFAFTDSLGAAYVFAPHLRADDGYAISLVAAPAPAVDLLHAVPKLCGFGLKAITDPEADSGIVCFVANEAGASKLPLVTFPTRCAGAPPSARLSIDSGEHPGTFKAGGLPDLSDPNWKSKTYSNPPVTGCDQVEFEPKAKLSPTNSQAESPIGMDVEITMPTDGLEDPAGIAQANLDTATVIFPKGMAVNPAAADGLGACSPTQVKLGSNADEECPASSKVGTVAIKTPLIEETLTGNVYVAKQNDNPFNSTLGLYMVFSSIKDGITIKVAGKLVPDPVTGQLTSIFTENPEAPFSKLVLHFNEGPRAPLINPPRCGTYAIHSEFSPWSAVNPANPTPEEIVSEDSTFQVTEGPNGGPCPPGNLEPKLSSGLANNQAGATSPFVLRLSREDGSQRFAGLSVKMPKGLVAYLKGVPYCPDSVLAGISGEELTGKGELEHPACPVASEIGTVQAGAGAGPFPFYAPGKAYLAGPYRGAPLSIAVVTPAVAGPFDLGNVVIRNALYVDPETAQVTVKSDPIPTLLHGLTLDVRDIRVNINRPNFTAAPTSCEPQSVEATVTGEFGGTALASNHFQAAGCENLGFKPKLDLRLFGGTRRGAHPRLTATLTYPKSGAYANVASASVALPHSEFLEQSHIRTVCTRVQFRANACPAGSVYGHAEATSPLLDSPLSGPVYLRSSDNPLPDLVVALRGPATQPIEVVLAGRVDSVHGGIRNRFEVVPDAPVTKFTLNMQGGDKGLLVNSRNLCGSLNKATARFTAHNGATANLRPVLRNSCKAKGKGKKAGGKGKRHQKRNRGR